MIGSKLLAQYIVPKDTWRKENLSDISLGDISILMEGQFVAHYTWRKVRAHPHGGRSICCTPHLLENLCHIELGANFIYQNCNFFNSAC